MCTRSLEPPRWGGSNEYLTSTHNLCFEQKYEKYQGFFFVFLFCFVLVFLSENFQFLVVKFSVYLNRRVFVMNSTIWHVPINKASSLSARRNFASVAVQNVANEDSDKTAQKHSNLNLHLGFSLQGWFMFRVSCVFVLLICLVGHVWRYSRIALGYCRTLPSPF